MKKTSTFQNALIWFGAGVSLAEILTGTAFAPLGMGKGLLAILIGHVIGCGMMLLAGLIGGRTGRSAMETVKMSFGQKGGLLFALLNVLQLVGWTAIMIYDGALAIGKRNHLENGITAGASFLPHDIFCSWGKITRGGPYDLVVFDPPSYQKGSFVAEKDYARLIRRLPDLLAPGGHALLCLNSPKLGVAFLQDQVQALAPGLRFVGRLANPPAFADVSSERALKVLVYAAPD